MLILTRKLDESVLIGDEVKVQVVSLRGNNCQLGIAAPADVKVLREELVGRSRSKIQRDEDVQKSIERALAANDHYDHAVDFPSLLDEIFDASCDYLTYRAAFALVMAANIKNRKALFTVSTALEKNLNKVIELLKKACFTPSVIDEYVKGLGAELKEDSAFADGVIDTIKYATSELVGNILRRLGESN